MRTSYAAYTVIVKLIKHINYRTFGNIFYSSFLRCFPHNTYILFYYASYRNHLRKVIKIPPTPVFPQNKTAPLGHRSGIVWKGVLPMNENIKVVHGTDFGVAPIYCYPHILGLHGNHSPKRKEVVQ